MSYQKCATFQEKYLLQRLNKHISQIFLNHVKKSKKSLKKTNKGYLYSYHFQNVAKNPARNRKSPDFSEGRKVQMRSRLHAW